MIRLALGGVWARRGRLTGSLAAVFFGVTFLTGTLVLGDTLAVGIESHDARTYAGTGFLRTFRTALAAFGIVAMLAAAYSVHNAFAITVAQRVRESALPRAVGASREQVGALGAVEALVVGGVGTLAGAAGGVGGAALLERSLDLTTRGLAVSAGTVTIAGLAGLLSTMVAALSPAVRAARMPPLAALRGADAEGGVSEARVLVGLATGVVYAMVAVAVVIALLGIAGALALGVHERTREIGLLRAVGASRAQVRSMVRWEALIVALFGTAGGAGLGLFAGWALTGALEQPFAAPPLRLAAIALAGTVTGVAAGLFPARRASRLVPRDAVAA